MQEKIQSLLQQLTLEEKAALCSGKDNWTSKPIDRLGIPAIFMCDGPHGLRREQADGFGHSMPATCFPTASALGASWNVDLLYKIGETLGKEAQAQGVQLLLGPGINMKRSPLGGRNFEYYSEDPILSGELAAAFVNGIQSQGVGATLKHFTANNQEFERMNNNSILDERALQEIYLPAFEIAVKKAQPWSIMCAYNQINGVYASEHKELLHHILKEKWGFEGFVISDWGAVHDRVEGIKAGLHFEMPGNGGINDKRIIAAVQNGALKEARLDEIVADLLTVFLKANDYKQTNPIFNKEAHHQIALQTAQECITLLKNEQNCLPLNINQKIAVIGQFAKKPRFQGGGSSQVNPTQVECALDHLQTLFPNDQIQYADGYPLDDAVDETIINQAQRIATDADVALLFVGLPDHYESEGFDRTHIDIPKNHAVLIRQIAAVQKNVVVILTNGSAVRMPWAHHAKAIVESWLLGQAGGQAIADLLVGKYSPSGKLAETFPTKISDNPSFLSFGGEHGKVYYGEGIFSGYRYYEKKQIPPQFPFGHGLSYTTFEYSNLQIDKPEFSDQDQIEVSIDITNTGKMDAKEVVQLYIKDAISTVIRPEKELKAFQKIDLAVGETKNITFSLDYRAFAYYNTNLHTWTAEKGEFQLLIGRSSQDIRQSSTIHLTETNHPLPQLNRYSTIKEYAAHPKGEAHVRPIMEQMMAIFLAGTDHSDAENAHKAESFFKAIVADLPLYKLETFTLGAVDEKKIEEIIEKTNA